MTTTTRTELRAIVRLALPLVLGNIGWMAMQVVDSIMLSHFDVEKRALAAASLGGLWITSTMFLGQGLILGIDPIVSQAHGAGDDGRAVRALQRGLIVGLIVALPIGALWAFTRPALLAFGQDPELAALAHGYALVQIPSLPLFLAYWALRQYLHGRGIMRPALVVTLWANLGNALFNYVLIYGALGAPRLGVVGAGIATSCTRSMMLLGLLWIVRREGLLAGLWVPWGRRSLRRRGFGEILRYGVPASIQSSLEIWAFGLATLMAGRLDTLGEKGALAANSIVLNMASVTFMIPLGISGAAVTRVGNLIGARRFHDAQRAGWVAIALGAGVMTFSAVVFFVGRHVLPAWIYGADGAVLVAAASILPIAATFQLFDGTQVVGCGVLRGMGQTLPAAVFNLVGYWVIALPLAAWVAFEVVPGTRIPGIHSEGLPGRGVGLPGVWWGLAAGLGIVAVCLTLWIYVRGPATLASRAQREAPADPARGADVEPTGGLEG